MGAGLSVRSPYYRADEEKQPITLISCHICVQSETANQHTVVLASEPQKGLKEKPRGPCVCVCVCVCVCD